MATDSLKVWVDFLCPFARIGCYWIRNVDAAGGLDLDIEWKTFSLENVNLPEEGSADELWATAPERRGLLPAAAAKWAETQGPEVFESVQRAFFDARHVDRKKIGRPEVVAEVLGDAGVDGQGVASELVDNPKWLEAARADYDEGASLGVFGVPTFVFPDSAPVFVRFLEVKEGKEAVETYERIKAVAADGVIHEIKRPSMRPS
jgi:predicted DsbA family dithiol-disulfide isomerase